MVPVTSVQMSGLDAGPQITIRALSYETTIHVCTLLGLAQGKLHVRSGQWIAPETEIRAQFEHLAFRGRVLYCVPKEHGYRVSIDLFVGDDQRREPRLPLHQYGTVTTLATERPSSAAGELLDLAIAGMRVALPHHVDPGVMIYIETTAALIAGEVRHCRQTEPGRFEAGIQVTDVLPGIQLRQKTRHFTSVLRKLARILFRGRVSQD